MSIASPPARRHEGSVLVVYVNFAVGAAVAQRLMESSVVVLAPAAAAETELRNRPDVVLLCPYLTAGERDALLTIAGEGGTRPAVLELTDEVGGRELVRVVDAGRRADGLPVAHVSTVVDAFAR